MTPSPSRVLDAAVFDVDGVVTQTATVHEAAWRRVFDELLEARARTDGEPFVAFSSADYRRFVDGVPRFDGVARFLASRAIELPRGHADDPPDRMTVCGIGNRKNIAFLAAVEERGVQPYADTIGLLERLRALGVARAAVSASENCAQVLAAAGVEDLFDLRVDGLDAAALRLAGKPDPAIFLEAARRLDVTPRRAVVVEDAISGVAAGHAGGFGLVVGVDRTSHSNELSEAGADVVVTDLGDLCVGQDRRWSIA